MKDNRLIDDTSTVTTMIKIYCNGNHGSLKGDLCDECIELAQYAEQRIKNCRFGEKKPVCGKCTVNCYKPQMREKIRNVMRYSGPRMILHPLMLFNHIKHKIIY